MAFKKVEESKKIYIKVAEQILEAIKEGSYQVGDRLPPERVLVNEMGVSRNSIREALGALQVLKIVESKTGDGTYIRKSPERTELESYVLPVLEESESPLVIFDARSTFEPGVAEMASESVTTENIKELNVILDQMYESIMAEEYERYYRLNTRFHLTIARMVENPIVRDTMVSLWKNTDNELLREMVFDYWRKNSQSSIEVHKQIFEAIKENNKDLVRNIVIEHYREPKAHFLEFLREKNAECEGTNPTGT